MRPSPADCDVVESTPEQIRAGAKRFSLTESAQARMRAASPDTSAQIRAALYREERDAMRAEAKAQYAAWLASLADPLPRIVGTHTVPKNIKHEVIGRYDAPYRTPARNK